MISRQLWLTPGTDTDRRGELLEANAKTAGIRRKSFTAITSQPCSTLRASPDEPGPCCELRKGGDPRTPDIIVAPNVGVVYTGSSKKQSEHGGYAFDDTDVMLLVSNPTFRPGPSPVGWKPYRWLPRSFSLLGLDPSALDAVRLEGTQVLPGLLRFRQPLNRGTPRSRAALTRKTKKGAAAMPRLFLLAAGARLRVPVRVLRQVPALAVGTAIRPEVLGRIVALNLMRGGSQRLALGLVLAFARHRAFRVIAHVVQRVSP